MPAKVEIIFNGVLEGHKDAVYALCMARDPGQFFSAGGDGMIVRWNLSHKGDGIVVARMPNAVYSLLYFKDSDIMIAGTRFGNLFALDLQSQKHMAVKNLENDIFNLYYIPGINLITAACANGYLYVLHPQTLGIIHQFHQTESSCRCLALSPDGKHLASGWSDGRIRIYDVDADFMEIQDFEANLPSVFSLVYNIKGDKLISGGRDAQIRVWERGDTYFEALKIPAHLFTVNDLELIPELGLMASASRDKTVKIWDANNFDLLKVIDKPKLPAHSHSVNKLLWTGFENNLVSAGDDKAILVWGIIC